VLSDVRGIAVHPDNQRIFVSSSNGAALLMFKRDEKTGKLSIAQVVRDGEGDVRCLNGAFTPTISPDNRFVLICSGRFHGDTAVSVFRLNDEGQMELVQELSADLGDIPNFLGANVLDISPDGRNVYIGGTRGNSMACFVRDVETGKLTWKETLADDTGKGELAGAAGVAVSPDGRHIYVAAEFEKAISVYERVTKEAKE
jgi:6-phosphogluconolactonase (cycloisomerase 2 family)